MKDNTTLVVALYFQFVPSPTILDFSKKMNFLFFRFCLAYSDVEEIF